MPTYESVYIARQDINTSQVDALTEQFSGIITGAGGTVGKTEYWGLRNLAYRIKKNRKGHYVLLNIDAPHEAVAEMERNMRLNEDVLRNLTVRVDELEEGPSMILQNKGRDDRGDRGDRGDRRGRDRDDRRPRRDAGSSRGDGDDRGRGKPDAKSEDGADKSDKKEKSEGGDD